MNKVRIIDFLNYTFSCKKQFKKYLKKFNDEDLAYLGLLIDEELKKRGYFND